MFGIKRKQKKHKVDSVEYAIVKRLNDVKVFGLRINAIKDVGRNSPCPCGSEEKFKRCCGG